MHMHLYTFIRLKDTHALTHSKYTYKHILLFDKVNPKIIPIFLCVDFYSRANTI